MRAGVLRDRVTLLAHQPGRDAWGQPLQQWAPIVTTWASVRFVSGLTAITAGKDAASTTASVRIRKRAVDPAWRLRFGGRDYAIDAVLPGSDYVDLTIKGVA